MKILNQIKDFINKHKIRIQVERCWKEAKPKKVQLRITRPDYNIKNIVWFQTIVPDVKLPYYPDGNKNKPPEQYIEYSGLNSAGFVTVNKYLETKN